MREEVPRAATSEAAPMVIDLEPVDEAALEAAEASAASSRATLRLLQAPLIPTLGRSFSVKFGVVSQAVQCAEGSDLLEWHCSKQGVKLNTLSRQLSRSFFHRN